MNFWDLHRNMIYVLVGFVLVYGVLRLFLLGGLYETAATERSKYESRIQPAIKKYTPANKTARVAELIASFRAANATLDASLNEMNGFFTPPFPKPLVPETIDEAESFVRVERDKRRDEFIRQAESAKGWALSEQAQTLGLVLPEAYGRNMEQVEIWMRQLIVLERFYNMLLELPDDRYGTPPIVSVEYLRPLPRRKAGGEKFMDEYPIDAELYMTEAGALRLLQACADKKSLHVVHQFELDSAPGNRFSVRREREVTDAPTPSKAGAGDIKKAAVKDASAAKGQPDQADQPGRREFEQWYAHYVRARLQVSCLVYEKPDKVKVQKKQHIRKPKRGADWMIKRK